MKALAAALALVASPVLAQAPCEIPPSQWQARLGPMLAGNWTVDNGPGVASLGGGGMPMGPEPSAPAVIASDGTRTTVSAPDYTMTMDVSFMPQETWNYGSSDPNSPFASLPALEHADIGLLADGGCTTDELPRVLMQGSVPIQGTTTLDITMRLFMISPDMMTGAAQFRMMAQGVPIEGRRIITFTR
ncbi:hypothetical protein [Histidinibacterium aquaticum]|uniref:Uncharacterized protein n=1 Tax=Histidinibacterium aquaticum TaxID=2613962 RepID=A0A5J5GND0_9RHOB|nr:hypothetical protein [Histidinibacterium aquaticum]KAA9008952.1 hypothetical protein F3S47_06730 [Histidinibacterium aquaticum]